MGIGQKVFSDLHLAFENRELRDVCLSEEAAARSFGRETSEFLRARLADMLAAETLAELATGRVRVDTRYSLGTFLVDLGSSAQLRFRSNHPKAGRGGNILVDPGRISRVIVIAVEGA
jgi:hypothetical protein